MGGCQGQQLWMQIGMIELVRHTNLGFRVGVSQIALLQFSFFYN
jgi:hypothetical protein